MGRPVRCAGCRKPFILRENGQAEKVEERPKTTSIHSATPRRSVSEQIAVEVKRQSGADREESDEYAPHTKAVANDRTDSELFPATASVDHQTDAAISRKGEGTDSQSARSRSSARLNAKQQRTRRVMAKNLSEAATMALTKVSERTEAVQRKASDRLGSDRITRKGHAGKASDGTELGPAILTGQGEAELANRRTWFLGLVALVLISVSLAWFFRDRSPQRQLLQQWGEPKVSSDWSYPYRLSAMRSQAVAAGSSMSIVMDIADAELQDQSEWILDPVPALQEETLRWHGRFACLVPERNGQRFMEIISETGGDLNEALEAIRLDTEPFAVIDLARFEDVTSEQGWSDDAQRFIWSALVRSSDPQAGHLAHNVDRWLAGAWPERLEYAIFTGKGLELQDTGTSYRSEPTRYWGMMVRGAALDEDAPMSADGWVIWSISLGGP